MKEISKLMVKEKKVVIYLTTVMISVLISVTGCSGGMKIESDIPITEPEAQIAEDRNYIQLEDFTVIYCDIYDNAKQNNELGSLEMMRSIINELGENGYVAVDSKNQIDMTESDKVIQFCEQVDAAEGAELAITVVSYLGGFTKYDFRTQGGNVDIVKKYYQYIDGRMEHRSTGTFRADLWEYTREGYLLFEGHWFSEESFILTLSEVPERAALRVQALDEKCRELNRKYMLPIGYGRNNMFIIDWNEQDFGELNFYDMYDIFYAFIYGQDVPYAADVNLEVRAVYQIPKEEFESVIMAYFNIDSITLQSKTIYHPEDKTYEYSPRGFYEVEYLEMPYPEVVSYVENSDDTITLNVNVVYPNDVVSKVYSHEVVIRLLNDGGVQYVSNRIIPSEDNYEQTWHVPRLTSH